jgi:uncharacterized UBP type Zn finger protein
MLTRRQDTATAASWTVERMKTPDDDAAVQARQSARTKDGSVNGIPLR